MPRQASADVVKFDAPTDHAGIADVIDAVAAEYGLPAIQWDEGPRGMVFARRNVARQVRFTNDEWKANHLPETDDRAGRTNQSGRSLVTARFVSGDWTLPRAVAYLIESGQFAAAVAEETRKGRDETEAIQIMLFNMYTVAKGWVAEKVITSGDRFRKLWETNDVAGQDALDTETGNYVQIRNTSWGWNNGDPSEDSNGNPVVYYTFTPDGQIVVSPDSYKPAHAALGSFREEFKQTDMYLM